MVRYLRRGRRGFTFICVKTVSRTLKKVLNKIVKCAREGLNDFVFKGKIMALSYTFNILRVVCDKEYKEVDIKR